jgi:hypothetical protein
MPADRTFFYNGLKVQVWSRSFKWTGMPFVVFLGDPPNDDKIRKMIDTAQRPILQPQYYATGVKPGEPIPLMVEREVQFRPRCPLCQIEAMEEMLRPKPKPERGFWWRLFFGPWRQETLADRTKRRFPRTLDRLGTNPPTTATRPRPVDGDDP